MVPLAAAVLAIAVLTGCGATSPPAAPAPVSPSSTVQAVGSGSEQAAPASATPLARSVPVRLKIPGLGVDTAVMPLGLASDGTVEVPPIEASSPAGWYDESPTPGQVGPSVVLGHVTVGQYGNGVFLHLGELRAGDGIEVGLADGVSADFTVDSVTTVAKSSFPTQAVYGNTARPELRLITCGGARDDATHSYPDNVIVYASLTGHSG